MSHQVDKLRSLAGRWDGEETGKAGLGIGSRTYRLLFDRYVEGRSRSEFEPQEANPSGEVHEELSVFSFGTTGDTVMLREFHSEGYVITYTLTDDSDSALVFESSDVENAPDGYRARLTLRFQGDQQFEELFELAARGRPFEEYIRNRWTKQVGSV